jgi:hypothetical protein
MFKKIIVLIACLLVLISKAQQKTEILEINWPLEYKWKIGSNQENETMQMMELIPGNETIEKWTILGTMLSIKGLKNVSLKEVIETTFDQQR